VAFLTGASEALAFFLWIPILALMGAVFWILLPILLSLEPVKRFVCWITRSCYHEWEVYACRVRWTHCPVCENELRKPNTYHPIILLRCKKCGEKDSEVDHDQEKTLAEIVDRSRLSDMEDPE
jgi:hypothetical protein